MEDLFSAHQDVQAGRVPKLVQFGSGPLSLLDSTQAPPGKHTTYCWHVMPLEPDLGGKSYDSFKEEFSDKIIECFARYCPNMTSKNILGRYVYTGREYVQEMINMRGGDIFMGGAISGGAGYISASVIADDLGLKKWWTPWDARAALEQLPQLERGAA
jgi:phytoene dehydrogenase-like protein